MKDKIIKILEKYGCIECVYDFTQDTEEDCLVNQASAIAKADEITALINDNYVPKFVNWMLINSAYSDIPIKEFAPKWNIIIDGEWIYKTTDELFEHWKTNIRDK